MKVEPIEPHGFCAGVTHALKLALSLEGVYCLHELVHNELVVDGLRRRGFRFVESVNEIPEGATVLFSAHGVGPDVRRAAEARRLHVVDATCPFVDRVHREAKAFAARGLPVVIVGNSGHAEVKGIAGELASCTIVRDVAEAAGIRAAAVGVVSQTTMNADEVREIVDELRRHCTVEAAAQVCGATKERQDAVKAYGGDAVLVLGSGNSSNTRRLCEVAPCRAFRAGTMDEVKAIDFGGVRRLGVPSGASTPESFFAEAVAWLRANRGDGGAAE